jgi:hypothetical protein
MLWCVWPSTQLRSAFILPKGNTWCHFGSETGDEVILYKPERWLDLMGNPRASLDHVLSSTALLLITFSWNTLNIVYSLRKSPTCHGRSLWGHSDLPECTIANGICLFLYLSSYTQTFVVQWYEFLSPFALLMSSAVLLLWIHFFVTICLAIHIHESILTPQQIIQGAMLSSRSYECSFSALFYKLKK